MAAAENEPSMDDGGSNWTVPSDREVLDAVERGLLHALTLCLYRSDVGYSLIVPALDGQLVHTEPFSYEQADLLNCVLDGHVPFFLVDLFEQSPRPLFYRNCMVVNIEDRRSSHDAAAMQAGPGKSSDGRVVLRPTAASLLADLHALLQNTELTQHNCLQLETLFWQHVYANTSDNPISTQKEYSPKLYDLFFRREHSLYGAVRARRVRSEQLRLVRQRCPLLSGRPAANLMTSQLISNTICNIRASAAHDNNANVLPEYKAPDELSNRRHEQLVRRRADRERQLAEQPADSGAIVGALQLVEEIVVVMEQSGVAHSTQIHVSRHKHDHSYWARLQLEASPVPVHNGPFRLGHEWDAKMYVLQYLEMITEGGRKQPTKVTRRSPGRAPHVVPLKSFS